MERSKKKAINYVSQLYDWAQLDLDDDDDVFGHSSRKKETKKKETKAKLNGESKKKPKEKKGEKSSKDTVKKQEKIFIQKKCSENKKEAGVSKSSPIVDDDCDVEIIETKQPAESQNSQLSSLADYSPKISQENSQEDEKLIEADDEAQIKKVAPKRKIAIESDSENEDAAASEESTKNTPDKELEPIKKKKDTPEKESPQVKKKKEEATKSNPISKLEAKSYPSFQSRPKTPKWTPPARIGTPTSRESVSASSTPKIGLRVGLSRFHRVSTPLHPNVVQK